MLPATFIISLDFELHWGVSDHRTIESYHENLKNTPEVIRKTLKLFREENIHATWATVGMLFCKDKRELLEYVAPDKQPVYSNQRLSNYIVAKGAGQSEMDDPFHYGNSLIKEIIDTPGQELSTHTFSHFYCLEQGQTTADFFYDLSAARSITEREGVIPKSIVFPRNQYNGDYLEVCKKMGIRSYRGNFPYWVYNAESKSAESRWKKIVRLADAYLPISGKRYVRPIVEKEMMNIPASSFLRPYNNKLSPLEPLKIARIKREMEAAAKNKACYHLWWHPHNFGKDMDKNFDNLISILNHFAVLSNRYEMVSLNMNEVYERYK